LQVMRTPLLAPSVPILSERRRSRIRSRVPRSTRSIVPKSACLDLPVNHRVGDPDLGWDGGRRDETDRDDEAAGPPSTTQIAQPEGFANMRKRHCLKQDVFPVYRRRMCFKD